MFRWIPGGQGPMLLRRDRAVIATVLGYFLAPGLPAPCSAQYATVYVMPAPLVAAQPTTAVSYPTGGQYIFVVQAPAAAPAPAPVVAARPTAALAPVPAPAPAVTYRDRNVTRAAFSQRPDDAQQVPPPPAADAFP